MNLDAGSALWHAVLRISSVPRTRNVGTPAMLCTGVRSDQITIIPSNLKGSDNRSWAAIIYQPETGLRGSRGRSFTSENEYAGERKRLFWSTGKRITNVNR